MPQDKLSYRELHRRWMGYELPPKQERHYNAARMIKLWKAVYNMDVIKIDGYKFNRHGRAIYNVYDQDHNLIFEKVTLEALYIGVEEEYNNPDY